MGDDVSETHLPIRLTTFVGRESETDEVRALLTKLGSWCSPGPAEAARPDWPSTSRSCHQSIPRRCGLGRPARGAADGRRRRSARRSHGRIRPLRRIHHGRRLRLRLPVIAATDRPRQLRASRESERGRWWPASSLPAPTSPYSRRHERRSVSMARCCSGSRLSRSQATSSRKRGGCSWTGPCALGMTTSRWARTTASLSPSICQRLDGMPLAIELAAARVRMHDLDAVRVESLRRAVRTACCSTDRRRPASADGSMPRWAGSFGLLGDRERTLLSRLSVFQGSFTLQGAEFRRG